MGSTSAASSARNPIAAGTCMPNGTVVSTRALVPRELQVPGEGYLRVPGRRLWLLGEMGRASAFD
eukprot:5164690-Pyramimonas_sp.AAC.1